MPSPSVKWTQSHTLAAFHLYTLLPFGKLHRGTPEVQQLAAWQGRTASSVAMTLLRFNGQAIRLPERFRPAPEFLVFHARRFGFMA